MRTKLPKRWCIKNTDNCLKPHAYQIPNNTWRCNSLGSYYFYKDNGWFDFEDDVKPKGYIEITLEEFKILVLGIKPQPTEPQYEIY